MTNPKYALITGASRGIGKAISYHFAQNGYHLYLTCKNNLSLLKEIKEEIETQIPDIRCHIFQCDMGNSADVEQLFQSINELDVIVNTITPNFKTFSVIEWHKSTNLPTFLQVCAQASVNVAK